MQETKREKINREMQKVFAKFIERESNRSSLITITRCEISRDRKNIDVLISVLPEEKEEQALNFLERKKWDARYYLKKNIRTRVIPFVHFKIDKGEKNRQKIDDLLNKV